MIEFLRNRLKEETEESERVSIRASIKLFADKQGVELLATDVKIVRGVDRFLVKPS